MILLQILWLILINYYVEQAAVIQKGWKKREGLYAIEAAILIAGIWIPVWMCWVLLVLLLLLYDLFFDEIPFTYQWKWIVLPGFIPVILSLFEFQYELILNGVFLFGLFLILAGKRECLDVRNSILMGMSMGILSAAAGVFAHYKTIATAESLLIYMLCFGTILLEYLLFFTVEGSIYSYKKGFEYRTEHFQKEVLGHQYEEIKNIYMNMRGWRHDYHNHLQVIKAQLTMGNMAEVYRYLYELEQNLDRVDTYVKSGNLMVDAILNSKLSLAERQNIAVNCKAQVPEQISVEDVDLCVILGNLLDNALEACEQIKEEKRFLRIYITVNKSQLYISIQNAAKEELNFNEKNYITMKRGNHGLGMKRVKAMVDKYEGYLNLANEPGIFAAEVTMPLE